MEQHHELSPSTTVNQHDPTPSNNAPNNALLEEEDLVDSFLLEDHSGECIDQHDLKLPNDDLCKKRAIKPSITTRELDSNIDIEPHRPSNASTIFPQPGIYRRTPMVMIFGLLIGISCFVGHYFWYAWLNGTLVGNAHKQQQALRVGTTLAVCAQVSLVFSIQKAYEQWLWRELKGHIVSFKGIDAACAASNDPSSFVNTEMWRKAKRASTLALLTWLIPISTFIAPATLNVRTVMLNTARLMTIPKLDISQAGQYTSYAYAVAGVLPSLKKYLGPRTIITRWTVAASSTGEIPPLIQPATNATYEQTFYAPYVHCDSSTTEVIQQVNGMINRAKQSQDPSVELVSLDYFAAVPALSNLADTSGPVQVANLTDLDDAVHASNQLWIYFPRYNASLNFSEPLEKHYLTCQLYNASYTTFFTWENGRQDLQVANRALLNPVTYPAHASTSSESEVSMSYSAVMWALSSQLTGSVAFYKDLNATEDVTQEIYASRIYSKITTNIAQTVLVGTSDLNSHFAENHLLGNGSSLFSDQRLQDMAYAGDRPLEILIPELSSNITLSLFTDPLLAPGAPTNVTLTSPANIYEYHKRNLLLAYAIAGVAALLANAAGLYAIWKSGVSHDLSFSSVVCASHGVHFSRDLHVHERLGALPLGSRIAGTRLAFFGGEDGRFGFGAAGERDLERG